MSHIRATTFLTIVIFEFILCDTDREYNKDSPANNPVAYAMKGNSINMNTARLMIEEV